MNTNKINVYEQTFKMFSVTTQHQFSTFLFPYTSVFNCLDDTATELPVWINYPVN